MKTKLLLIATLLPFVIIWQLFTYQREQVNPELEFKRDFRDVTNSVTDEIKLFGNPPDFFEFKDDKYYVYNVEDKRFLLTNKQGKTKIFPEKNTNDSLKLILSFIVDSNNIIGIDQISRKVVKINTKSGVFKYNDIPKFIRGVPINDTALLLVSLDTITKDRAFYKYNVNTKEKEFLNIPLTTIADFGLSNDGFFAYSEDRQKIIYILYHLGKVITFDKQCQIIESFNTLDNYRFNPIVVQKGDRFYLSRKTVSVNNSAAMNEESIFILSDMRSVEDKKNNLTGEIIDIYDAKSPNKYKYSINIDSKIMKGIIDIKAHGNYLYLMTSNKIIKIDLLTLL
jgi:hypothetical protein